MLFADNLTKNLVGVNMVKGLDPGTFRDLVSRMVQARAAIQNVYEVVGAVEFEYTFWAKPDNESAVRQNLIDVRIQLRSQYINSIYDHFYTKTCVSWCQKLLQSAISTRVSNGYCFIIYQEFTMPTDRALGCSKKAL